MAQYIPTIRKNYTRIDHEIFNVAVSDRDGAGKLQVRTVGGGTNITHSTVIENPMGKEPSTDNVLDTTLMRLSSLLAQRSFPQPILLKIDVDGHELAILQGLQGAEDRIGAIVIEATLLNIAPRIDRMQKMGFILWEINDLCYYKGCLWQVDMILLSQTIAARDELRPLISDTVLQWEHWQTFQEDEAK